MAPRIRLRELVTFLTDDVLPHERDDERLLYPQVAETLGGTDPTATMSREHAEIAELIRRIEKLTGEVEQQHDSPAVLRDLAGRSTNCTRCSGCTTRRRRRTSTSSPRIEALVGRTRVGESFSPG